jgi:lipopolysaccharide transport protein LptA
MAVSIHNAVALLALALAASQACAAAAAHPQQLPITLDAQSSELDLRTNTAVFHKVHIAQGDMSVTADQGQATRHVTGLDFENSVWLFRGNVKIAMDQGQILSDDAAITFANKVLAKAVVNGKPAEFEQHIEKTGKLARGRADSIDYDVGKGVVHLLNNAWLSDGQNEIRGESLKYDVVAQNIVAEASEQGSQRVHIIITPPANPKP